MQQRVILTLGLYCSSPYTSITNVTIQDVNEEWPMRNKLISSRKHPRPFSDASVVKRSFKARISANKQQKVGFLDARNACIQQVVGPQVSATTNTDTVINEVETTTNIPPTKIYTISVCIFVRVTNTYFGNPVLTIKTSNLQSRHLMFSLKTSLFPPLL